MHAQGGTDGLIEQMDGEQREIRRVGVGPLCVCGVILV